MLDSSVAFDTIHHGIMLHYLRGWVLKWIQSYISDCMVVLIEALLRGHHLLMVFLKVLY